MHSLSLCVFLVLSNFSPHWSTRPPHTDWTPMCIWLRPIACVERRTIGLTVYSSEGLQLQMCCFLSDLPVFSLMPLLLFHCNISLTNTPTQYVSEWIKHAYEIQCIEKNNRVFVCVCVWDHLEKVWDSLSSLRSCEHSFKSLGFKLIKLIKPFKVSTKANIKAVALKLY